MIHGVIVTFISNTTLVFYALFYGFLNHNKGILKMTFLSYEYVQFKFQLKRSHMKLYEFFNCQKLYFPK